MNKRFIRDALGWGALLWLIGYVLGILLFAIVPPSALGLIITPIGVAITLWVLLKKIEGGTLSYYLLIGLVWTAIAIVGDYVFIVWALHPADGYYKLDV